MNNIKLMLYYADLICEKIDMRADASIERIEAMIHGEKDKAEFIEEMMLQPLDRQIRYLAKKASNIEMKGSVHE